MYIVFELLNNSIFWVSMLAWFLAQSIKVMLTLIVYKKVDIRRFIGSGGMPSAHSALVVCLAVSIGQTNGYDSHIFALAAITALIVMYDAAGVRRATGKQAAVLNEILEEIQAHRGVPQEKLKELIGHTPVEVFAGALLGMIIALLCFY